MSNIEKLSNAAKHGVEAVKQFNDVKDQLVQLKDQATTGIETGISALMLKGKIEFSKHLPKELDMFLNQVNPLVEAFTSVQDLLEGGEGKGRNLQDILNEKLYQNNVMDLLGDQASSVIMLRFAQENPTFLYKLFMQSDATDPEHMTKGTRITLRNQGAMQQQLISFLDQNATVAQILPDPTISGLKVKTTEGKEVDFTRKPEENQFKDKEGNVLRLSGIDSMTVTALDGSKDRRALWTQQRKAEISEKIMQKLDGDVPEESYIGHPADIAAGKRIRDLYRKMPYREKLSPGGSFNAGCYKTAENLARHIGYDLHTRKPLERNDSTKNLEEHNMLTVIPRMIKEKDLKPGTVFWIKKDLSIFDPQSLSSAAGNHFFTYVGTINAAGREEPYFVDQFGFGNLARMNFSYPKRYFYSAYTPPNQ